MEKLLLTVTEAGELIGFKKAKAYELAASEWPVVRVGKTLRVPLAGLRRWVAEKEAAAGLEDHSPSAA